jgi:hypothetical protein
VRTKLYTSYYSFLQSAYFFVRKMYKKRFISLKENGGMGIHSLTTQNEALLTKWLSKLRAERQSLYGRLVDIYMEPLDLEKLEGQCSNLPVSKTLALQPLFTASVVWDEEAQQRLKWRWTTMKHHDVLCVQYATQYGCN